MKLHTIVCLVILILVGITLVFWNISRKEKENPFYQARQEFEEAYSYENFSPETKEAFVYIVAKGEGWKISDEQNTIHETGNMEYPYSANKTVLLRSNDQSKEYWISREELYLYDGYSWQMFSHSGYKYYPETREIKKDYSSVIWGIPEGLENEEGA